MPQDNEAQKRKKIKARAKKAKARLGAISGFFGGMLGSAAKTGNSRKSQLDAKIRKATGGS